jgi:nanoRNase/pAp phosphatase (c-di-AMP/oligoRNAs hydrolase)
VNVGKLLARYDGGGHRGAGACRLEPSASDGQIKEILAILIENKA